ncbi:MAG: alpha/beta fold hydrolase [Gammaproteobacteria bacterium]|nr:alpha/beta fold hydrolase [Gammaproteobacteria bacterium]
MTTTESSIVGQRTSDTREASFVLLNPVGMDSGCWQFLGYPAAKPFHYPGHAERPREPGWTFEQIADEVVARIPGPMDLLGISMGGAIAAHVLVRHPGRVRSAIIACSAGIVEGLDLQARLQLADTRAEPARQGGMQAVIETNLPRWFTPHALRTGHPGIDYTRATLRSMDPEAWVDIWLAQARTQPLPHAQLRAVTVPVTLVAGMHDTASGVAAMNELHELLPNSRMEIVSAPHMIHLERPESLAAAIERHRTWQRTGQRVDAILSSSGL